MIKHHQVFYFSTLNVHLVIKRAFHVFPNATADYWFSYELRHIDINNMNPSLPARWYLHHSQIFDKIDSFLKMFSMFLPAKTKVDCIFEELLKLRFIIFLVSFSSLLLPITAKNRTKMKKAVFNFKQGLRWIIILQIYILHLLFSF